MPCPWVFVAPQAVLQQGQFLWAGWAIALCYSPTQVCVCEGPCFKYQSIYFSPRESCLLTKSWGLNGYNKIKSNKTRLMGWDERHCISSVKDKHIMQLMTQKNILQHLGLLVTTTSQVKWKKKREVEPLPQPAGAGEAPSHAATAFGNKHRHGKVTSRAVISFRARQHEAVTHHQQHSCSRHQMGEFMAEMGTDIWGTLPEAHSSPPRTSLRHPIYSYGCWVNPHTKIGFLSPPPATERCWPEHILLVRSWITASNASSVGARRSCLLRSGDQVRKYLFIAEGILETPVGKWCRVVACHTDRLQSVGMTCVSTT